MLSRVMQRVSYGKLLFWLAMLFLICFQASRPLVINHDVAGLLQTGQLLAEGKLPYQDFPSSNPPLIMYLCAVIALVSKWLAIHIIIVFLSLVTIMTMASALIIQRALKYSTLLSEEGGTDIFITALAGLSGACLFEYAAGLNFGQREHVFVLMYLPFMVVRHVRWHGGSVNIYLGIFTAIFAAIGACLKPHFVLMTLLVELGWFVNFRKIKLFFKPEFILFAVVGLVYGLHFLFLPEEMKQAFFGRWLPIFAERYDVYNGTVEELMTPGHPARRFFFFSCLTLPLAVVMPKNKDILSKLTMPLALFTLGGVFIFFMQHKFWIYHLIPAFYGGTLLLTLSFIERVRSWRAGDINKGFRRWLWLLWHSIALVSFVSTFPILWYKHESLMHVIIVVALGYFWLGGLVSHISGQRQYRLLLLTRALLVIVLLVTGWKVIFHRWEYRNPLRFNVLASNINKYSAPGEPVLFFSTSMKPAYPLLVQMERPPGSRYLTSIPIALMYKGVEATNPESFPYHTGEKVPPEEQRIFDEIAEDIATNKPPLIIIANPYESQGAPEGFVLKDLLESNGFITKAMREYRFLPDVLSDGAFVYLRKDRHTPDS